MIETNDVPPGVVSVPVTIDDNRKAEYKSYMFAGHLAFQLKEEDTALQPSLNWAIALVEKETCKEAQKGFFEFM